MILINFAHPVTPAQKAQIETLLGKPIERLVDASAHFDTALPFAEQAHALVEAAALTGEEWQTLPLLVNLPALSVIAALTLAELHGRCGYFPAIVRLRVVQGSLPPQYEVAELLNLQGVRDSARGAR